MMSSVVRWSRIRLARAHAITAVNSISGNGQDLFAMSYSIATRTHLLSVSCTEPSTPTVGMYAYARYAPTTFRTLSL